MCVSENPDGGGEERGDVACPTPRPRPQSPGPGGRGRVRPLRIRGPESLARLRPQGGVGKSESCGGCISIFNLIVLPPPSSFRFSHSSPLFAF